MTGKVKNRKETAMKKKDVKVGATYVAKVSGGISPIRLDAESPYGGWDGTNLDTGRKVRIKSAQRLRGEFHQHKENGTMKASKKTASKSRKPQTKAKAAKARKPAPKSAAKARSADGKMSGLNAAVKVLSEAGEALDCKTIVTRALEKGYWKTTGKTPQATVYAAIIREIAKKGGEARFRKTERGKFALSK